MKVAIIVPGANLVNNVFCRGTKLSCFKSIPYLCFAISQLWALFWWSNFSILSQIFFKMSFGSDYLCFIVTNYDIVTQVECLEYLRSQKHNLKMDSCCFSDSIMIASSRPVVSLFKAKPGNLAFLNFLVEKTLSNLTASIQSYLELLTFLLYGLIKGDLEL